MYYNIKKFLLLLIFLPLFLFCGKKKNTIIEDLSIKEERILFPDMATDDLLNGIRDTVQKITFNNTKDTSIVGATGISIFIPSGVFVDEKNKPVENITIELLEAVNVKDFLINNLETVSGDSILQSGGMFFINATSNGKPVDLKKDNSLLVQVPVQVPIGDMKVFYGNYNPNGVLDWQQIKGSRSVLENNMITIPFDVLRLSDVRFVLWKETPRTEFVKKEFDDIQIEEYENTYIATKEFKSRLAIHAMGVMMNKDSTVLTQVLDIYKANVNNSLFIADSLVEVLLTPHFNELMTSLNDSLKARSLFTAGDKSLAKREFGLNLRKGLIESGKSLWLALTKFKELRNTKPFDFKALGISDETTNAELLKDGYTEEEAGKILFYYNRRKGELKKAENENSAKKKEKEMREYIITLNKFGWINIDRFLNDPTCEESDFEVRINNHDSLMNVKVSLMIPGRNIVVNSISQEKDRYGFTQKSGMLRKLPINDKAIIVVLGSASNKTFFASKNIEIPKTGFVDLDLVEMGLEDVKREIDGLIKKTKR